MALRCEVTCHGAKQAHGQKDYPDDDMYAMKSRRHEEDRPVDRAKISDAGIEVAMCLAHTCKGQ